MSTQSNGNINQILNLVDLAEDKSPTQRKFLFEKIGNFLIDDNRSFSTAEKELMADIICRITSDVERSIRAHFSKTISTLSDIPKDLIVFLANDEIEVALPILENSPILDEFDLIKLVQTRSSQHQLAIAARSDVSEAVASALCETENENVCLCLLNNLNAAISEETLEILCVKSEVISSYQNPLINRPFLPKNIAEKMYRYVSIALREIISEKFQIDPKILSIAPEDRAQTILSISEENDPSNKLIEKLYSAGELTNGFLLKSLHQGEIDLFEISFAKLSGLTRQELQKFLYTTDPKRLAIACRSLDLDRSIFGTILDLVQKSELTKFSLTSALKEDLITFYTLLKKDAVMQALANKDFVDGRISYSET